MTLVIVLIFIVGYILLATTHLTNVNKAAIAMFMGTVGWVLYICYGTDFVMSQHPREYFDFLAGALPNSDRVKFFIYEICGQGSGHSHVPTCHDDNNRNT